MTAIELALTKIDDQVRLNWRLQQEIDDRDAIIHDLERRLSEALEWRLRA